MTAASIGQLDVAIRVLDGFIALDPSDDLLRAVGLLRKERLALLEPYRRAVWWALDFEGYKAPTEVLLAAMGAQLQEPADPDLMAAALADARDLLDAFDRYDTSADERRQYVELALRPEGGEEPSPDGKPEV